MPTSEQVGRNEALFREVNERIREVSESLRSVDGSSGIEFVCECSRTDCHVPVELELGEYESIRESPVWFLVAPGHVWATETERLVRSEDRYSIVEKLSEAGEVAADEDPRG